MTKLRGGVEAPRSPFPILPLRTGVLFPGTVITLPVGRERSLALLRAVGPGAIIGVVPQRDPQVVDPGDADVHRVGTFARIQRVAPVGPDEVRVVLEGLGRLELDRVVGIEPYWLAEGRPSIERNGESLEARELAQVLREQVMDLSARGSTEPRFDENPSIVADQVAASLGLEPAKELALLSELDVVARLRLVVKLLGEARAMADIKRKIDQDVRREVNKNQREAFLREQMRAIRRELGDDRADEAEALRERLEKADLPDEVRAAAERELKRLEGGPAQGPEAGVIRTYLEWILELPWNARAEVRDDLDAVASKLDADHAGLQDVKRRILEHMAVLKVAGNRRGTILCLAGPPGVGKTSLGQSIADATCRPLVRVALGGVGDEAELRGHRRTYVGALPGRIVSALRKAKVKNPVMLLDEVDKLGQGWRGSPEAALLEILDPEQNKHFTDHYMELPFDLSEVLFICTANNLENLSAPLRDRLEIIEISGYTADEKVQIAKSHLVPKLLREHGLGAEALEITDEALAAVVRDYTREAGVRQLNRELTRICRALTLEVARAADRKLPTVRVDEADVGRYLGKVKFFSEVAERTQVPGVATGLAWTPVGGDILFIETSRMPGKGRLEITGQLGDVMKESARAALTYVRSNAKALGVDPDFLEHIDLHIHVPAGAVPKDGPSAGVTIFTALTSLLTGRRVRSDTAMTGEVTLRGRVMPVGGIKSKVLAAHRAGITRVVLPAKNARDLDEVPAETRKAMEFVFAEDMSQVLAAALEPVADLTHEVPVPPPSTSDTVQPAA